MRISAVALLLALSLAGCKSPGPISETNFTAVAAQALPQDDGEAVMTIPAEHVDQRRVPSMLEAMLTGRRLDPTLGAVVLTPHAIYLLKWDQRQDRYQAAVTIPVAAIIDARFTRFGLGAWVDVETREPMHLALGQPEQTGLYRIKAMRAAGVLIDAEQTEAFGAAVRHAMTGAATQRAEIRR